MIKLMKLFLSSYRIPVIDDFICLIDRTPPQKIKLALIPNAKDYYAKRARDVKINKVRHYFEELGFQSNIIDLREYKDDPESLFETLSTYDVIWAMGGNTFILREVMEDCNFNEVVRKLLAQGKVYGGESAGAIVAGSDLHGVEVADDPEFASRTIWEGLGLTDYFILPHADNPQFNSKLNALLQSREPSKKIVQISDTQALVINGRNEKIVEQKQA